MSDHNLILPNGLRMHYALRWNKDEKHWLRKTRHGEKNIWGGTMAENTASSLARVLLSDAVVTIKRELGLRPALLVHDDACYIVPEDVAEETYAKIVEIMSRAAPWWQDGPAISADGRIDTRYGKAA
jgi:hypothetical protein